MEELRHQVHKHATVFSPQKTETFTEGLIRKIKNITTNGQGY